MDANSPNESLEVVDLRTAKDGRELLKAIYDEIYVPSFPIPEEQEDPCVWERLLWEAMPPPPRPIFHVLVAGEHLGEPREWELRGFVMFEYFRRSESGLVTYLAVSPRYRRRGLGSLLVAEAICRLRADADVSGGGLKAVFAETNDPRKVGSADDSLPPLQRLEFFSRLGARWLSVRYVQPELAPGQGRCRDLILLAFPIAAEPVNALPSATVRAFLEEFYTALGVRNLQSDPDFANVLSDTSRDTVEALPFCALAR